MLRIKKNTDNFSYAGDRDIAGFKVQKILYELFFLVTRVFLMLKKMSKIKQIIVVCIIRSVCLKVLSLRPCLKKGFYLF